MIFALFVVVSLESNLQVAQTGLKFAMYLEMILSFLIKKKVLILYEFHILHLNNFHPSPFPSYMPFALATSSIKKKQNSKENKNLRKQ